MSSKKKADANWTSDQIVDQTGKVAIVTGANSGLGYEVALALVKKGATVVFACRNEARAKAMLDQVIKQVPHAKAKLLLLDLADLDSVHHFTNEFESTFPRLDILINNAGVMMPPYGRTKQGFEIQFGINHLAHFVLTGLLIKQLMNTTDSRIVTVSSYGHKFGNINFDDLNWTNEYSAGAAYAQSKLANLLFCYELQRRLESVGSTTLSVAAHPGRVATNLHRYVPAMKLLNFLLSQHPGAGAWPILYAATSPDVEGGGYYGPNGFLGFTGHPKTAVSNDMSYDKDVAHQLWSASENLTRIAFDL